MSTIQKKYSFILWIFLSYPIFSQNEVDVSLLKKKELIDSLGLTNYVNQPQRKSLKNVKLAILDRGFKDLGSHATGSTVFLPPNAFTLIENYMGLPKYPQSAEEDIHGRIMAQTIFGLLNQSDENLPQVRLYNISSIDRFLKATQEIVKWKADVVVSANHWQGYGRFDGTGFLNEAVNDVCDEGTLWIQDAGNNAHMVYNGPVRLEDHDSSEGGKKTAVRHLLPDGENWFLKFRNFSDENIVTITLSWNSTSQKAARLGTDKDLDLYLHDDKLGSNNVGRLIASSQRKQVINNPNPEKKETLDPIEQITVPLNRKVDGYYYIYIRKEGGVFDSTKDKLRVTLSASKGPVSVTPGNIQTRNSIEFLDATSDNEIGEPGTNPNVFTVGDLGNVTSISKHSNKPDTFLTENTVSFSDRLTFSGTSFSTALLGAVVTELKAYAPQLKTAHLKQFKQSNAQTTLLPLSGWKSWQDTVGYRNASPQANTLVQLLGGKENIWFKRHSEDGRSILGSTQPIPNQGDFRTLPEEVRKNPEKYDIFMYYRQVRNFRNEVRQRQVEGTGRYTYNRVPVNKTRTRYKDIVVNEIQYRNAIIPGYIVYNVPVLVAVTKSQPYTETYRDYEEEREWIPARYTSYNVTVEDEPTFQIVFWSRVKGNTQDPIEVYKNSSEYKNDPGLMNESIHRFEVILPLPAHLNQLNQAMDKIWQTPTPAQLSEIVSKG